MAGDERRTALQGMSVPCPPEWTDSSILILTAKQPGKSGVTPNFVVTREALPQDLPGRGTEQLRAFLQRQHDKMHVQLPQFRLVSRRDPTDDYMTGELRFVWFSDGTSIMQSIIYAFADEQTVFSSTATAGENDFDMVQPIFRKLLQGFRQA